MSRPWMKHAARVALGGALVYALVYLVAAATHRRFVFPRPRSGVEPQLRGTEILRFDVEGGLRGVALYGAPRGESPVVVFFHGNGQELVDLVPLARSLMDRGLGILFVEYPGYGITEDTKTTEAAIYAVGEAAIRKLHERDGASTKDAGARRRIVLMGQSLGTGAATEMAARGLGDGLVLISPFTSIVDMVGRFVPFLPTSTFVSDRFDNLSKMDRVRVPMLVFHGDRDRVVPVEMGRAVTEAHKQSDVGTKLVEIEGGSHNDLFRWKDGMLLDLVVSFSKEIAAGAVTGSVFGDRGGLRRTSDDAPKATNG